MRSRQPGIGRSGTPSCSSSEGSVRGGGGSNGPRLGLRLVLVEGDPHLHAAVARGPQRVAHLIAHRTGQPQVVEGQVKGLAGRAEPVDEIARDILGLLAPFDERSDPHRAGEYHHPTARLKVRLQKSEFATG